ncbi:MAG: HAD family hydrolase [Candidatus Firestonebacteria bacterium]|nr:HAD family hydrolase [Candidatus Firestonebacteria bacterium]
MAFTALSKEQIKKDSEQQLNTFKRTKDFLVAIDTDGCVADNMNGKQMLIFQPQYLEFYQLWELESYFREIAEYYNLFSVHRGCNRFLAYQFTVKALYARKDVQKIVKEKGIELPDIKALDDYIEFCSKNKLGLGHPSLEKYLDGQPFNLSLYKLLGWSEAVNRTFPYVNTKIPPFGNVRESLELMNQYADVLVVSQTPYDDLLNYWQDQNIAKYIQIIAGQEMGNKAHHIASVKKAGGYKDNNVLMLGDADGDLKGVKANNGFFYPILPGFEQNSWNDFPKNFGLFTDGKYAETEKALIKRFSEVLLPTPPWEKAGYDHVSAYREKQEARKVLYSKLNPNGRLLKV